MRMLGWIRRGLAELADGLKQAMAPEGGKCELCGRLTRQEGSQARGPSEGQGRPRIRRLCKDCAADIPWIASVQCEACGRPVDCPDCRRPVLRHLTRNRSAVSYNRRMKELLALYKYRGSEKLFDLFGDMLEQGLAHYRELSPGGFDAVTFVPLSGERLQERGFNQAEQLSAQAASRLGRPLLSLLLRERHTAKQSFKTRGERLRDLRGAFTADEAGIAAAARLATPGQPLRILIVDDVYTTGSTLNECAKVIRGKLDAEVYGLTWAR